jgi:DNA-binding response OmpR family regulator
MAAVLPPSPTILVVEDDQFLVSMYAEKLLGVGYRVLTAADGTAGLRLAEAERPDLVLLDVLLPRLDGFEVLRRLKANAATRHLPVIILTNLGEVEDVERGKSLGAVDYLVKAHFVPTEVVEKISQVLARGL